MTKEQMINTNWNKICKYIKENYNGVFEDGFEWGYGAYGYEFVLKITADGEAYATSHLTDKPREIVIKERIVTDWKSIKERIKERAELYTNFEA